MNYYSFHIGDYIKQTVHLTPMEDICYRRLLDMYYETEQPIPTETDRVSRRLRLDTELVDSVLKEFFTLTEKGWENARCEGEITAYHVKADTARSNGKLGGRPKKTKSVSDRNPAESGSKANQEPRTNNQEPITTLSPLQAKPDPVNRLNGKTAMVEQVMTYLNLQARRNYRVKNPDGSPTAGAMVIAKRLKEGYTVDQCKDVIGEKSNQWMGDERMDQYLNPQTLFRKSNFDKYLTEAEAQQ